jgi:hypothetical protein
MNFKRLLGIVIAVCAVAVLVGSIGAGAAPTPAKHARDLSTNAGVREYLRSVGISSRGVVIQRGARNYAGRRCPGKRWTCTRSHRVVQVATGHGKNRFRCTAARCVVVQATKSPLAASSAKCVKTTGITQSCLITQTGTGPNTATVIMVAKKLSGLTQNASQTATIVQTADAALNKACVFQRTEIDGSTVRRGAPVNVTLDAHQSISITQDSHSGGNTVQNADPTTQNCAAGAMTQWQSIVSKANGSMGITQNQNTLGSRPNMVVDVEQNQSPGYLGSASGANNMALDQTNTLAAIAIGPGPVSQTQSTTGGGLETTLNQFSHNTPESGLKNTAVVNQFERQCVHSQTSGDASYPSPPPPPPTTPTCPSGGTQPTSLTQVQHGPMRKGPCCSVQGDNFGDSFAVNQSSTQDSDGSATQTNTIEGECTSSGNCTVVQNTNVDGDQSTNVQSGQNVSAETNCTGSTCTTTGSQTGGQLSIPNTDVGEFGFGGMRNDGTGTITVGGVSGTVTKALLYWNGPTNSTDPTKNATVNFAGSPVTGVNLGFASDNCWGFLNSHSYRADVTPLVTGDGTYSLANFTKPGPDAANINGVALLVFYDDGNSSNDRNIVLWNGNDSNIASSYDPGGWDATLTGVQYQGGTASIDFIVSDGQTAPDPELLINGTQLEAEGQIFSGETLGGPFDAGGSLWDVKSFDLTPFLVTGSNPPLNLTTGPNPTPTSDCISLVAFAANVPSSAPVILGPAAAAKQPAAAQRQAAPTGATAPRVGSVASGGVLGG